MRTCCLMLAGLMSAAVAAAPDDGGDPAHPGVRWRALQTPGVPGPGAIAGGPGNDPSPGAPMVVCRAEFHGGLLPGRWVRGFCQVADDGDAVDARSYEVAYGNAVWLAYRPGPQLIRTGRDNIGNAVHSCRVRLLGADGRDHGWQPGQLAAGVCRVPLEGREQVHQPPFEALYAP